MNIFNKLRNQAKEDSRRFAKSVVCKIVHELEAISIIKKYNIAPQNFVFNGGTDDFKYMDTTCGKFFAIPSNNYPTYIKEIKKINLVSKQLDSLTAIEKEELLEKELEVIDYLRQVLILISIPQDRWPKMAIPDPTVYDIVIETTDIGQSTDCQFVLSAGYKINRSGVANGAKKITQGQEKW